MPMSGSAVGSVRWSSLLLTALGWCVPWWVANEVTRVAAGEAAPLAAVPALTEPWLAGDTTVSWPSSMGSVVQAEMRTPVGPLPEGVPHGFPPPQQAWPPPSVTPDFETAASVPVSPETVPPETVPLEALPTAEAWEPVPVEEWSLDAGPPWDENADDYAASQTMWVIGGRNGMGWFSLEDSGVLSYWGPEGIGSAFGYSVHFLEGPRQTDLPPRLFGLNYGVRWRDRLTERWSYELAVAPGIYTDFEDSAREGLRIQGHGFAMLTFETVQFVLGIDYLDRETISLLPLAGLVWAPNDATRLDLVFPRPRLARRVRSGEKCDHWCFVSAEYGGGSWSVERDATGLVDLVTLNEIRIAIGLETQRPNLPPRVLEVVLLTDRELEYRSGVGNFRPEQTVGFAWRSGY